MYKIKNYKSGKYLTMGGKATKIQWLANDPNKDAKAVFAQNDAYDPNSAVVDTVYKKD